MRDLRKIKSKYEFKLDNKQIAFLFAGAMVVLVVVFALGVVVGKGMVQIQNIESAMELQAQVENNMPVVPDIDVQVEDAVPEQTPDPDTEGYINILKPVEGELTPLPLTENVPDMAPEPTPIPETTPPPPTSQGKFTIQLSSHPTKDDANTFKKKYESKGLTDVYIISATVKGAEWYRVRTGHFATKEGANQFAQAIKAKGIVAKPWVTAN